MQNKKIKVLIVDDSATIRSLFSQLLSSDPEIEVVDMAEDPFDAREKIKRHNPDVITLDVEMPKMDGITFLEKIMALRPMPVVMASTLTTRGADITIRALEIGAVDYIAKPKVINPENFAKIKNDLLYKVKNATLTQFRARSDTAQPSHALPFSGDNSKHLILLGASTGGVEAIRDILLRMPANSPPIVITQHMPEIFTASFAKRMDSLSAMTVCEAIPDQRIKPGFAYIAAGNYHLEVDAQGGALFCRLHQGDVVSGHRPSVDVLFHSAVKIKSHKMVAAILTGMGRDGAEGLLALRNAGAVTFGQTEASCVVYGMPKAAKHIGAVEREIALRDMPQSLLNACLTSGENAYARRQTY